MWKDFKFLKRQKKKKGTTLVNANAYRATEPVCESVPLTADTEISSPRNTAAKQHHVTPVVLDDGHSRTFTDIQTYTEKQSVYPRTAKLYRNQSPLRNNTEISK